MAKVLAIGAHFDDIEIGVGGTLLKHVNNNDEVFVAITSSDEIRTGDVVMRYQEQLESINMFGIKEQQLLLFKESDVISDIVGILDKLKADVVYIMFESDTHQAHRRCSYIGQAVGRKLATQLIFYNSGTSYNFLPNVFSIISFEFKRKLLQCFRSQIELNVINIDIIKRRESYWASLVSGKELYAEGLMVRKMIYEV